MNELYLSDTQTKHKHRFEPGDPRWITMYVCGPTVYNYVHIGNARPVVVFDTLFRLLRTLYPRVTYARNITDIDDKIMEAAREEASDIDTVSRRYTEAFHEDMAALGSLPPSIEPKATEHLPQMIAIMETLIDKGHAYVSAGHVLFAVESMPEYGQLSHRKLEDMIAGARVDVAEYKRHPGDFVLWKPSAPDEPGWDSPWGRGRPGWHTECVVMIESHLGDRIDIHGGGKDLVFPHHENELAQSYCAHDGAQTVRYWLHNAFIQMDGEKMSKSLGNVRTVRDLLQHYRGEVLRLAILSAHYRSELDFSRELLDQSRATLDSLYTALREVQGLEPAAVQVQNNPVYQALLDDLNTPEALSALHQIARDLNKAEAADKPRLKALLLESAGLMGLLQSDPEDWFKQADSADQIAAEAVEKLIAERQAAKKAKDFARADEIRDALKEQGVILEDSRSGTTWRRA